jgi:murein DD-endopeptidase MepM/ murein hydrolase activator NlpD
MPALTIATRAAAAIGSHDARRRLRCLPLACLAAIGCIAGPVLVVLAVVSAVVAAMAGTGTASTDACSAACAAGASPPLRCPRLAVSQGFGDTPWEHPHTGIDLVCPQGTAVHALMSGVLHRLDGGDVPCLFPIGRRGGLGTFAAVVTGGITVLYGHLKSFATAEGESVVPGQTIGYEGATGCATGPHLHLEVDRAGVAVDPCPFLPAGYPAPHESGGQRCWGNAPP